MITGVASLPTMTHSSKWVLPLHVRQFFSLAGRASFPHSMQPDLVVRLPAPFVLHAVSDPALSCPGDSTHLTVVICMHLLMFFIFTLAALDHVILFLCSFECFFYFTDQFQIPLFVLARSRAQRCPFQP